MNLVERHLYSCFGHWYETNAIFQYGNMFFTVQWQRDMLVGQFQYQNIRFCYPISAFLEYNIPTPYKSYFGQHVRNMIRYQHVDLSALPLDCQAHVLTFLIG